MNAVLTSGAKVNKPLDDTPQEEKLHGAALAFLQTVKKDTWKDTSITAFFLNYTSVTFEQYESEEMHFTFKHRSHFQGQFQCSFQCIVSDPFEVRMRSF